MSTANDSQASCVLHKQEPFEQVVTNAYEAFLANLDAWPLLPGDTTAEA